MLAIRADPRLRIRAGPQVLEDITVKLLLPEQDFKDMDLTDTIQLTEAFQGILASVDGLVLVQLNE